MQLSWAFPTHPIFFFEYEVIVGHIIQQNDVIYSAFYIFHINLHKFSSV